MAAVSGRRRRTPGLLRVRVICRDPFHRDTAEYRRRGFHFVCALDCHPVPEGRYALGLADYGRQAVGPGKDIHADGQFAYKLLCSCGRDVQLRDTKLGDGVVALFVAAWAEDPRATRVDLNIATF